MSAVTFEVYAARKKLAREYIEGRRSGYPLKPADYAIKAEMAKSSFLSLATKMRRKAGYDYRDELRAIESRAYEDRIKSLNTRGTCPSCGGIRDRKSYCTPCDNRIRREWKAGKRVGCSPFCFRKRIGERDLELVDDFIDKKLAGEPTYNSQTYADKIGCALSTFENAVRKRKAERGITRSLRKGRTIKLEPIVERPRKNYTERLKRTVLTAVLEGEILTHEAGQELGVTERTIARWIKESNLTSEVRDCRANGSAY